MLAVKSVNVREHFKEWCDKISMGDTISFTMEELKAMEAEDWQLTEKILEFEHEHGIQRNGKTTKYKT